MAWAARLELQAIRRPDMARVDSVPYDSFLEARVECSVRHSLGAHPHAKQLVRPWGKYGSNEIVVGPKLSTA